MASNLSSCSDDHLSRGALSSTHWSTPASLEDSAPAVAAAYASICGLAFSLNLLVLVSLLRKHRCSPHEAPSLALLFNLHAVGLTMALLVTAMVMVPVAMREFPFGSDDFTRCQVCLYAVVLVTLSAASLHTVAALATDRAIFVLAPSMYERRVTPLCAAPTVVVVWAISIALAVPPVFGYGRIDYDSNLGACLPRYSADSENQSGYVHLLAAEILLPSSVTLAACVLILFKVRRWRGEWGREGRSEFLKAQQQWITAFFGAVVAVAFTELPALSAGIIAGVLHHRGDADVEQLAIGAFIAHLASFLLLPIATALLLPEPRAAITHILHCRRTPPPSPAVDESSVSASAYDLTIENRHASTPTTECDYSSSWNDCTCTTFQVEPSSLTPETRQVRRSLEVFTTAINRASSHMETHNHLEEDDLTSEGSGDFY